MAKKLGAGIVGCGWPGGEHAKAYKAFPEDCELIAFCDIVEKKAKARCEEFGIETLYTDFHDLLADERIHIVSVCTPHYLHAPMAIQAAKTGKHVLVEKPMAMNIGEAMRMIHAAEDNNVKLSIIFGQRFRPHNQFLKEKVIPELGRIIFSYLIDFHYRTTAYYDSAGWRGTWKLEGGGVFINQAIHFWDLYQWLNGGVVNAFGYWTNILHPTIEVEDIGYGFVEFGNSSFGKLFTTSCCEAPQGARQMRIIGEKGELEVFSRDFVLKNRSLEQKLKQDMEETKTTAQYTGFPAQIRDFLDAIAEDKEPFITGDSAKESLKMVNGIHWNGWHYQDEFRKWIYKNYELPNTIEDVARQKWGGGKLIQDLMEIVKSSDDRLKVPFLE